MLASVVWDDPYLTGGTQPHMVLSFHEQRRFTHSAEQLISNQARGLMEFVFPLHSPQLPHSWPFLAHFLQLLSNLSLLYKLKRIWYQPV